MERSGEPILDLTLCFGSTLFAGDALDVFHAILQEHAPAWCKGLHVWRDDGARAIGESFSATIRGAASERGELYRALIKEYGPGEHPRRTGSVELRGGDESIVVAVGLDEQVFAPSAGRYLWGNSIHVQVCQARVAGEPSTQFVLDLAARSCSDLGPFYARAQDPAERSAKNLSRKGGGMMAVGVDVSRYLPGLYWLNFFGSPYCDLIRADRLLSAPAYDVARVGNGVLVVVDEDPSTWSSPRSRYRKVLDHIGDKYFFLDGAPDRSTVAPDYDLKPLRRLDRFT